MARASFSKDEGEVMAKLTRSEKQLLLLSGVIKSLQDLTDGEIKTLKSGLVVADKRAFPVNMRMAIGNLSLNDAAKIGYLRGLDDAQETIKSKSNIHPLSFTAQAQMTGADFFGALPDLAGDYELFEIDLKDSS